LIINKTDGSADSILISQIQSISFRGDEMKVSNEGLVLYCPFNGNANDSSGNQFNGVVQNATLTNDRFGNPKSAYSFNGNGIISFGDILDSVFCKPLAKFSIVGWAKSLSSLSFGRLIIGKLAGGQGPYQWDVSHFFNTVASCGVFSDSLAQNYQLKRINLGLNKWFHFALVFDGSLTSDQRIMFYVNTDSKLSEFVKVGSLGTTTQNTAKDLTIGGVNVNENNFVGDIDEIRIYNRALSEIEILALYRLK